MMGFSIWKRGGSGGKEGCGGKSKKFFENRKLKTRFVFSSF